MNISGITTLANSFQAAPPVLQLNGGGAAAAASSSASFGATMRNAIESLDQLQIGAEHAIARTVAGDAPDLHRTMAALQTAELSFQFALQVRNKMIDAYQEIMRMQV